MKLAFVVAMDQNRGIGFENALPWHMPADLQHFKRVTLNKPVLMGRKTHEAIGRPLPNRRNIIMTRDKNYQAPGCEVFHCLDAALTALNDIPEVMVIGGEQIFRQLLPQVNRVYLTIIKHVFTVDSHLPEMDFSDWTMLERTQHPADAKNPHDYEFITYDRTIPVTTQAERSIDG